MRFLCVFLTFISLNVVQAADTMDERSFAEKWQTVSKQKNSLLCVGLDPTVQNDKVEWCLGVIEKVAPFASAVKINRQFIRDLSEDKVKELVQAIHAAGMLAIDDSKFSDIGSSNEQGIKSSKREGFDAITYSPFAGNIAEAIQQAHQLNLGIFTLVLMSNPEYETTKNAQIKGKPFYQYIAEQVAQAKGEGVVVGASSNQNHITLQEIANVKGILPDQLVLVPGVGAQGGDPKTILQSFKGNTIINVGRAIITDQNPAKKAKEYQEQFYNMLKEIS